MSNDECGDVQAFSVTSSFELNQNLKYNTSLWYVCVFCVFVVLVLFLQKHMTTSIDGV